MNERNGTSTFLILDSTHCTEGVGIMNEAPSCSKNKDEEKSADNRIVYGGLYLIGCNGSLPNGDRGRKCSKFILTRREKPNGVKKSDVSVASTIMSSQAVQNANLYSISFSLSEEEAVIVEYIPDDKTDIFQIGRASDEIIDFIVLDKYCGEKGKVHRSTVSKYACRVVANRANPSDVRIYAAGFDKNRNIFFSEKAVKWKKDSDTNIDALTTNGVMLCNPEGLFCGGELEAGVWREVSVCGNILSVRGPRSSHEKGREIKNADNLLRDGSLIDLCGATLLWRSPEGLKKCVSKKYIEDLIAKLNSKINPEKDNIFVIPTKSKGDNKKYPHVYLSCGHVHGGRSLPDKCPICKKTGLTQKLCMGMEFAFYVDDISDQSPQNLFAFNPCGHIATEKTVKYWARTPLPHGTSAFQAICPFCATELQGYPGYIHLLFSGDPE